MFIFVSVQQCTQQICKTNNHDYGVSTNLYSLNENGKIVRENLQKILSVLAAHQIALWEYDIITGKCSFTDDYFRTLGLKKKPELFLRILMTSIGLLILMIWMLAKSLLQQCLPRNQRLHRYGFVVSENIRKLFASKTIFSLYKGNDETHPGKLLAYTVNVTIPKEVYDLFIHNIHEYRSLLSLEGID